MGVTRPRLPGALGPGAPCSLLTPSGVIGAFWLCWSSCCDSWEGGPLGAEMPETSIRGGMLLVEWGLGMLGAPWLAEFCDTLLEEGTLGVVILLWLSKPGVIGG